MRDFTLAAYEHLLKALREGGYRTSTFREYVGQELQGRASGERVAVLRHDVDRRPENAVRIAEIEADHDVQASYYFRIVAESFVPTAIRAIAERGHEIGYHYEDLTLARGDVAEAAASFVRHLAKLRVLASVDTMCMHGSPLSRWDNRDLFDHLDYRAHGILAEPYLDLDFDRIRYLTDTGRTWDGARVGVRDRVESRFQDVYRSTFDVAAAARKGTLPDHVLINTHPERWSGGLWPWSREWAVQRLKNVVKRGLVKHRQRRHAG